MAIEYFKTDVTTGKVNALQEPAPGCWVSATSPTREEIGFFTKQLGLSEDYPRMFMDEEERSHIDIDDDLNQVLIVADCPYQDGEEEGIASYDTLPFYVVIMGDKEIILTVTPRNGTTIDELIPRGKLPYATNDRMSLTIAIMIAIARRYQRTLRAIENQFKHNERQLRNSMKNRDLERMLEIQRSLVYLSTSLNSMKSTLFKMSNRRLLGLTDDEVELLEDAMVELQQAEEMCNINTQILNGTMETFTNIINNGLNAQMRRLTILTLVLAVPTIVFSFYGMNTNVLPFVDHWIWPLIIALIGCAIAIPALAYQRRR